MHEILLLIENRENRRLLAETLDDRYQVIAPDPARDDCSVIVRQHSYDLGILDGPALDRCWGAVQARKADAAPLFLPFLLVTPRQNVGYATRHLWQSIDEIILSPIEKVELQARVEILLRARAYSREQEARRRVEADRDLITGVLERVSDGIVALDKDWNYTYLNPQAAQMLGRQRPANLMGKNYWEEYPEAEGTPFAQAYQRALEEQVPIVLEDYYELWDRWFENRIYPSPEGITIFFTEITERKQAEETIQQQSKNLTTLLQISQTLAATLDLETVLQTIVESATHLVGLDSGAIYLLEGEELYLGAATPPLPPQFPETFRRASVGDHPHIHESVSTGLPVILPDTATADLTAAERAISQARGLRSILYLPLLIEKRAVGTLILGTVGETRSFSEAEMNLYRTLSSQAALAIENARLYQQAQQYTTELEQRVAERTTELAVAKERAESADRLKSAFLATMSHELRTPLNSIIGFTGIMLQGLAGPLNPEQEKQLNMVYGSARHLLALINDILDLSKIEAGEVEIVREEFDVASLINKVVKTVSPLAERKGLELAVALSPEVGRINSDRRRVEQILLNLVTNAIKFTKRGWVRIEGAIVENRLQVTVQDTGIGIKPEDMGKLFQVFRQVDTTITREHEGTGLGLAICKKLVTMLGGEIWAESEWGAGSTFTLPLSD